MKIGYLIADFPVLSETFVVNDMRGLEELGHEVVAISLGGVDPATVGNPNYTIKGRTIRVKGLGGNAVVRKLTKLAARRRLMERAGFRARYNTKPQGMPDDLWRDRLTWDAAVEQVAAERFDWLYVHFATRQLLLGFWASYFLDLPLGVTLQAHDIFTNPLSKWFDWTLRRCKAVVTVSHYNREAILKLAPSLPPEKVKVLANGIDIDTFAPRPHDPHHPFRFVGTGRLVEIKGFHVLIEAVGLLAQKRRDFRVSLIGDGPLRESFEQRIVQLNVGDVVELLGKRDATFLKAFLPDQDCFVLPCVIAKDGNRDGMPLALREGMSCGLPAISTQLLGLHETVSPGTGTLVAPDDPAALSAAMDQMIDLPPQDYRAMATAARRKAEAEFSLRHEVSTIVRWMADDSSEESDNHEGTKGTKKDPAGASVARI
jgi:glycosyltransferase involved in cell wall biosynthesis